MSNRTGSAGRVRWLLALGLGLAAIGLNLVRIEVISGVYLLLGHFAVLTAAVFLGPWPGMIAGAIGGSVTPGLFGHPWIWVVFVLEGVGVGLLARRFRPLWATGIFWLAVSGPFLAALADFYPFGTAATIAVKSLIEAQICALVLQVLAFVPKIRGALGTWLPPPLREVRTHVVVRSVLLSAALVPLVVLAAADARLLYRQRVVEFDRNNRATATALAEAIEDRISEARIELGEIAVDLESSSYGARRKMGATLLSNPLLREMVQVEDGRVVASVGVPRKDGASLGSLERIPPGEPLREIDTGTGLRPFMVVAAPAERGEVVGAVDPAMFLENLPILRPSDTRVLLLDREWRVIADSGNGKLDPPFRTAIEEAGPSGSTSYLADPDAPRSLRPQATLRVAVQPVEAYGLRVVVAREQLSLQPTIEAEALALLGGLAVAILVVLVVAITLTRLVVDPVRAVSRAASHLESGRRAARVETGAGGAPVELRELADDFDRMADRLERQLEAIEAASRAKDEFLSVASHELKTPLTILKAQVQLLERRASEAQGAQLRLIDRQLDRITRLISQLLDASAVGAGVISLDPREFELSALVRRVAEDLVAFAPSHDLRLDLEEVTGRWDELRLEQVFHNLIGNAIKYSPAGGALEVTVRPVADGGAEIRIADRGIGLSAGSRAKLFERFGRGDAPAGIGGFGVGLYVVRAIVERHGGTVELTPRDGGGAVATVRLPREAPSPPRRPV